MANSYANSSDIFVFPTTKREMSGSSRSSRLFTEQNLVSIVNKLLDVESFVISDDGNVIYFNIYGYLFELSKQNLGNLITNVTQGSSVSKGSSIWANIFIEKTGDYEELYGIDENGSYTGVVFSLDSGMFNAKNLKLLEYDGVSTWFVPDSSRVKFKYRSLQNPLDCGEI